jgi:DNA-binding MarR family transcriptional regulator
MGENQNERGRCNCAALRKASRRLSQFDDVALSPSGLRSTQYAILVEVERRAHGAATIQELADALVLDQSTLGQNLRPLERDGLLVLAPDPSDRRRRNVKLTRKGVSRLAAARPLWSEAQTRFEDGFGAGAASDLRSALLRIASDPTLLGNTDTAAPARAD